MYVNPGGAELIAKLRETKLSENKSAKAGLDDMELLFKYLQVFGVESKVCAKMLLGRKTSEHALWG